MSRIAALFMLLASCSGFVLPQAAPRSSVSRTAAPQALVPELPFQTIAEIVDATGERVYGSVDAPVWVPIVGGIAAIATALLPM